MDSGKERIVSLLMRRDGISEGMAIRAYEDTKAEILEALYGTSCMEPEDVLACELGLELDYIFDFI